MNKITNVSEEDLNRILTEANKQEAVPVRKTTDIVDIVGDLKPKSSEFEPDPIKFDLPSGKKIINEGHIFIRSLNSDEEYLFTKIVDDTDLDPTINRIFETAIKSNISVKSIPISDKIAIFIKMICLTYNGKIDVKNYLKCNHFSNTIKNIDDLKLESVDDSLEYPFRVKYCKYDITFGYPTIAQERIEAQAELLNRSTISILSDGVELPKEKWGEFYKYISFETKKEIGKKLSQISEKGGQYILDSVCEDPKCEFHKQRIEIPSIEVMEKAIKSITDNK